jgi:Zn-dependent metalloprotease
VAHISDHLKKTHSEGNIVKFLKPGLSLALLGAGLAFVPASPSAAVGLAQAPADPTGISAMRRAADGDVRVTEESATGAVGFVAARGARADLLPAEAGDSTARATAKADAYLDRFGATFGASQGELKRTGVTPNRYGWTVSYVQEHQGVEVFASRLKANVDKQGDLVSVSGFAVPDLDLSVEPRYTPAEAAEVAVGYVQSKPTERENGPTDAGSDLEAVSQDLVIYRAGALRGDDTGKNVLAYVVEVTGPQVRDIVVIDANTRKPINRWSTVTDALERELYEQSPDSDPVWSEGDAFPGDLNEDQQNLVNSAGESYWLYRNTFGRDSYDGLGAVMRTVNNDPGIQCPNANWNGSTTNYCDGVTSDDVVSHEWAHAYTEYTSGLIYQYQSGALNEAYSDVWGETLDLVNGREDEGETFDAKRPDGECDPTASPTLEVAITAPAAIAGPCRAAAAAFGDGYTPETVTTDVVVATDAADAAGPSPTDGCGAFTNAAAVAGSYAYVDRGTCPFQTKVDNAEAAGASGIVFGNNVDGLPIAVSGTADISGIMVTRADGVRFKSAGTSTIEITAEDISERTESTRWLVGEKSTAFGGAIRDMWSPTCYGDPGKVTDEEYNCDPLFTDNGGVHGNSGVPNHAYALMVDGGEYNGETVTGMGLDKAANIWWRAQTAYLTPSSDFVAAADGLEQSCADLVGQPINQVSTETDGTPTPAEPITAADCTQVATAIRAVEMRVEPVQCDFQPLLQQGAPSLCGPGFAEKVIYSEDFEDGLKGWTPEQELASLPQFGYEGGFGAPWETAEGDEVPGDHAGTVARGPAPSLGDCSGDGENDFSSRDSIISPVITMPAGGVRPRLTFEHYVATEGGFDGGNMKVSVNGGDFEVIPAGAYTFNAPDALAPATLPNGLPYNTNPLAGEDAFTGTDGGTVTGSWGESQVDLNALEIQPGDLVQLRVDIGRDGCGGLADYSAWMVDNIEIVSCVVGTDIEAVREPATTSYGEGSDVVVTTVDKAATGAVTVSVGDEELGEAEMRNGRAVVALPDDLDAGTYEATVSYEGDSTHAPSTTELGFTVEQATTRTRVTARSKVKQGKASNVTVRVRAEGLTPDGEVVLKKGRRTLAEGVLRNGRVTLDLPGLKKAGRHELTAKYLGTDNIAGSSAEFTVRVVKKKR